MSTLSNDNGRALEFKVVSHLEEIYKAKLANNAIRDNARDIGKFKLLPADLQSKYAQAANRIGIWLNENLGGIDQTVIVNRHSDSPDEVTDISIRKVDKVINLSLKHNHHALKHPRPYSLAQFCNYPKNSPQDIAHRERMTTVDSKFRNAITNKSKFRDCSGQTISTLYRDICSVCEQSLNDWSEQDKNLASNLFSFLVSSGYYKIIVNTTNPLMIQVQDYLSIRQPSSLTIAVSENRLIIKFNNGWVINSRIHTASSTISKAGNQLSLKFDSQRDQGLVNTITL